MDLSLILIIIGILLLLASFFFGRSSKLDDELEQVSISLHHETNQLKKRLRVVEEELMIGADHLTPPKEFSVKKPIHEIIINQIITLHNQNYSIQEIADRASLTPKEVQEVLHTKGLN